MAKIRLPLCFLPNSKVEVIDTDRCARSPFQIETVLEISRRPDFAYFVTCGDEVVGGHDGDPKYRCPFHVIWYDKDGGFHGGMVGRLRMRGDWNVIPGKPVPLDGVVYSCRTEG